METRQIILDTETTGLYSQEGDRIIEIACVEIMNGKVTGNNYQTYINPERDSHPEALQIHGLTTQFLANKPKFIEIADSFLQFVAGAELIIHNAPFDVNFLTHELNLIGKTPLENHCDQITDTRVISQSLYTKEFLTTELISKRLVEDEMLVKAQRAKLSSDKSLIDTLVNHFKFRVYSLDHLCKYYNVNLSTREKNHGALIDCELLAQVYFHMQKEQKKRELDKEIKSTPALDVPTSLVQNMSIFQSGQAQTLSSDIDNIQFRKQLQI